jgi:large subunit ribosomal protein L17
VLRDVSSAKKLIEAIAPSFDGQAGGYTRVIRYKERHGDGAPMAFLEFTRIIEKPAEEKKEKGKKKKEKPPEEKKKREEKKPKAEKPKREKPTAEKPKVQKEELPKKEEGAPKEEQKKGGFLTNLRKFLTGE